VCSVSLIVDFIKYPEDGGDTSLQNVGLHNIYTAAHPRRRQSPYYCHYSQLTLWCIAFSFVYYLLKRTLLVANLRQMNSVHVISFISLTFTLILSSHLLNNSVARTKSGNANRNLVACIHRSVAFLKSEDYNIIKSYSYLIFYTSMSFVRN
jgi:hypothetical protein